MPGFVRIHPMYDLRDFLEIGHSDNFLKNVNMKILGKKLFKNILNIEKPSKFRIRTWGLPNTC